MPGGFDGGVPAAFADDDMTCSEHPLKNSSPSGGICAFCLQEKLGKLVSSSSSSFLIQSSSSSSSSFRSDLPSSSATATTSSLHPPSSISNLHIRNHRHATTTTAAPTRYQPQHNESSVAAAGRIPFVLTPKKKKSSLVGASSSSPSSHTLSVFNRSKSTTAARSRYQDFSTSTPRRHKGFWSFLHLPSSYHKKIDKPPSSTSTTIVTPTAPEASTSKAAVVIVDEADDSPNSSAGSNATSSFGRKVSRSRSVGCGSRSFSGDLFERISNGFGDCTLRRVESQREGSTQKHRHSTSAAMREKVRCGGLLGGLMMMTSSSSSSTTSSSGYWAGGEANPKPGGALVHGRSRSWGWAFASPRRAFGGKPTNSTIKDGKSEISNANANANANANNDGSSYNLASIPSLLAVRV